MSESVQWKTVDTNAPGPLAGLRVVELSHVLAGPVCGLMLADMGADVIKVERPPRGDTQRWDVADEDSLGSSSASFFVLNRGKRSVVLDLKDKDDREQLLELIAGADILVENYRVGVLDRLGFGYEELQRSFPGLIYCSITGFGQNGPWADRGGFDLVIQAMSGIMSFTGEEGSSTPVKCGPPMTDIGTGITAVAGILAALYRRTRTGQGDHVDTALLDNGVLFTTLQSALALTAGIEAKPMGTAHPLYAPYEVYQASDGWIAMGTANEVNWQRFLVVLGVPGLAEDPRFATTGDRVRNRQALKDVLTDRLMTDTRDHWVEQLSHARVPCGPVLTVAEMLRHPQVRHRNMVVEVPHRDVGVARGIGCPIKFREAGLAKPTTAPELNEH